MRIENPRKLAPFSHTPGTCALIPGTLWEAEVFPALVRLRHLVTGQRYEKILDYRGPVLGFTVQQDLEKGFLRFFGTAQQGYFCSYLKAGQEYVELDGEKLPLPIPELKPPSSAQRLSFGVHKAQNWDFVRTRLDPCEIWPFWLLLAQQTPAAPLHKVGSYALLQACEHAQKVDAASLWRSVFMGCFQGILSPRLFDEWHQGLFPSHEADREIPAVGLLHEGARLIRSLFFAEQGQELFLLPHLPPQCHAGRFIRIKTARGDELSMEWSKKRIKKVLFRSAHTGEVLLKLQKGITSFRIRRSMKDKGQIVSSAKPFICEAGTLLYLDRFLT
jgi:hypothetical protein